jgi:hypothetical protein
MSNLDFNGTLQFMQACFVAFNAKTLACVGDSFRYRECVYAWDITNSPTPSEWAGAVARIPNTQGVVSVWLMADGDAIDTEVLISPMPDT